MDAMPAALASRAVERGHFDEVADAPHFLSREWLTHRRNPLGRRSTCPAPDRGGCAGG